MPSETWASALPGRGILRRGDSGRHRLPEKSDRGAGGSGRAHNRGACEIPPAPQAGKRSQGELRPRAGRRRIGRADGRRGVGLAFRAESGGGDGDARAPRKPQRPDGGQ
ncbi:hypothetical protein DRP77_04320, partial [Candidatus Poribacteria bacterium]